MSINPVLKTGDEDQKNENLYGQLQIVTPRSFQHRFAFAYPIPLFPLPRFIIYHLLMSWGRKNDRDSEQGDRGR
jgi:hypothetical protein